MTRQSRRECGKTTGAARVAGGVAGGVRQLTGADVSPQYDVPPHTPLPLTGVHAYTDKLSVAAGETIRFHVSSTHPYRFEACRLGTDVDGPTQDEVMQVWQVNDPVMQPIHPGSYIHVENGLPSDRPLNELTLECWIRLWNLATMQGIITQHDVEQAGGFALMVDQDTTLAFYIGDELKDAPAAAHRTAAGVLSKPGEKDKFAYPVARWHHVVATFAGGQKEIWVDGRRLGRWETTARLRAAAVPLRI